MCSSFDLLLQLRKKILKKGDARFLDELCRGVQEEKKKEEEEIIRNELERQKKEREKKQATIQATQTKCCMEVEKCQKSLERLKRSSTQLKPPGQVQKELHSPLGKFLQSLICEVLSQFEVVDVTQQKDIKFVNKMKGFIEHCVNVVNSLVKEQRKIPQNKKVKFTDTWKKLVSILKDLNRETSKRSQKTNTAEEENKDEKKIQAPSDPETPVVPQQEKEDFSPEEEDKNEKNSSTTISQGSGSPIAEKLEVLGNERDGGNEEMSQRDFDNLQHCMEKNSSEYNEPPNPCNCNQCKGQKQGLFECLHESCGSKPLCVSEMRKHKRLGKSETHKIQFICACLDSVDSLSSCNSCLEKRIDGAYFCENCENDVHHCSASLPLLRCSVDQFFASVSNGKGKAPSVPPFPSFSSPPSSSSSSSSALSSPPSSSLSSLESSPTMSSDNSSFSPDPQDFKELSSENQAKLRWTQIAQSLLTVGKLFEMMIQHQWSLKKCPCDKDHNWGKLHRNCILSIVVNINELTPEQERRLKSSRLGVKSDQDVTLLTEYDVADLSIILENLMGHNHISRSLSGIREVRNEVFHRFALDEQRYDRLRGKFKISAMKIFTFVEKIQKLNSEESNFSVSYNCVKTSINQGLAPTPTVRIYSPELYAQILGDLAKRKHFSLARYSQGMLECNSCKFPNCVL